MQKYYGLQNGFWVDTFHYYKTLDVLFNDK